MEHLYYTPPSRLSNNYKRGGRKIVSVRGQRSGSAAVSYGQERNHYTHVLTASPVIYTGSSQLAFQCEHTKGS